jgi:hypothetical protein
MEGKVLELKNIIKKMTEIIRKPRTDRFCQRCGRWNGTKTWDGQRQISFVLFNGFFVCDECEDDMMDLKDVDDFEAPNIYPYKKCTKCEERKSCGSYDEDRKWLCEDCCAD